MTIRLTKDEEKILRVIAAETHMTKTDVLKQSLFRPRPINIPLIYQHIVKISVAIDRIEAMQGVTEYSTAIREELVEICHLLDS